MDTLKLCIDIGNTSTKAAVYRGDSELEYIKPFTVKDYERITANPCEVLVSKTGSYPELEAMLDSGDYLSHTTPLPIVLDYDTPHTLGRDRIATATAAYHMDPTSPWLIVDLGTCLTVDLLVDGVFLGGLISPGVQMRLKAMHTFTAGLPLVGFNYDVRFPGKTTEQALQVGVCQSIGYELEGYIREMTVQFPGLKIVDCSSVKIHFGNEVKNEIFARSKLVLQGLKNTIEYNAKNE